MSLDDVTYLVVWTGLSVALVVSGGIGLLLAPFTMACGIHRSHLGRRRGPARRVRPT